MPPLRIGAVSNKKIRQLSSHFARTNAAVSVVPPKLPTRWACQSLLCALPVESTAAITSGARLPLLLRAQVQGEARGCSFGPRSLRGSHLPALSAKEPWDLTFPGQNFFLPALYHGFLSVSTQQGHFCAVCSGWPSFCAQWRHNPYNTLPSHCKVKPCSAIRWARTSSMKWQSR